MTAGRRRSGAVRCEILDLGAVSLCLCEFSDIFCYVRAMRRASRMGDGFAARATAWLKEREGTRNTGRGRDLKTLC